MPNSRLQCGKVAGESCVCTLTSHIPGSTAKIRRLRIMLDAIGSDAQLEVDGGVYTGNIAEIVDAGADVIVAGSAIFRGGRGIAGNIAALRTAVETIF